MHVVEIQPKVSPATSAWNTRLARHAFIEAFSGTYDKPEWCGDITILEPPHDAENHIAVIVCNGEPANIKILPNKRSIHNFWDRYHSAEVVAISIQPDLSPAQVRKKVFSVLGSLL